MATAEEITAFRLLVDEPTQDPYSDVLLSSRIDAASTIEQLASTIWLEKAATYSGMVDMQEGTSRRSLSQLQEQALAMSRTYSGLADASAGGSRRTTTRPIERA